MCSFSLGVDTMVNPAVDYEHLLFPALTNVTVSLS